VIIQPRPFVTSFLHDTAFCPSCGRVVYATAPGELRNCPIGPTTKTIAIWLHHQLKLPLRPVQELFSTLFGMSFVPASALNFSRKAAIQGQPLYEDLRDKIRASSLLYLDETTWRIDGQGAWLWYAGNTSSLLTDPEPPTSLPPFWAMISAAISSPMTTPCTTSSLPVGVKRASPTSSVRPRISPPKSA
jgi:hypothetical protein